MWTAGRCGELLAIGSAALDAAMGPGDYGAKPAAVAVAVAGARKER